MILKDFIAQIRHTKIDGVRTMIIGDNLHMHKRFLIESFNGSNIEKLSFEKFEDIPETLLQATFIKMNIQLDVTTNPHDLFVIEFIVKK